MFKHKPEESGKSTIYRFAFKIFFVHIMNIIIMLVYLLFISSFIGAQSEGSFEEMLVFLIMTVICFLFYVIAVYVESWRTGLRDFNLVLYKHIEYNKFKPLIAALVSQIPGIILAFLMLLPSKNFEIQRYARYFYTNFLYPISILDDGYNIRIVYFIPILFAIAPSIFGYFLGYKGTRILDRVMFVRPKRNGKKRENLR